MMVLEIECQHAESRHTLVLIQVPEIMLQSQDEQELDQFFKSYCTFSWHSWNWNSDCIHDKAKSKLSGCDTEGRIGTWMSYISEIQESHKF